MFCVIFFDVCIYELIYIIFCSSVHEEVGHPNKRKLWNQCFSARSELIQWDAALDKSEMNRTREIEIDTAD